MNRVQRLRKEAGYEFTTRIALWVDGPAAVLEAARAHAAFIQGETLARALHIGVRATKVDRQESVDLEGHDAYIAAGRHTADPA